MKTANLHTACPGGPVHPRRRVSHSLAIIAIAAALAIPAGASAAPDVIETLLPLIRQAESSGRPGAIGDDGASLGLYQIGAATLEDYRKATGTTYKRAALLIPQVNEKIARWYLRRLNDRLAAVGLRDSVPHLILAYNWGLGNLRRNGYRIPGWALDHRNETYRKLIGGK